MFTVQKAKKRKKVNFMIDENILTMIQHWIPAGDRSDFVNGALDEALQDIAKREASDWMDKFRKKAKWHMTDAEIRKAINYGRK